MSEQREKLAEALREAIRIGGDYDILRCNLNLLEVDEQMRLANLTLPKLNPYDKRALQMGADPATIYTGEDLATYERLKEQGL